MANSAEENTTNQRSSELKHPLQSIFADIESTLPTIDFDASDVSSDEEVAIFQRHLKQEWLADDEKDLDESLSEELWTDVFYGGSSCSDRAERRSPVMNKPARFVRGCDATTSATLPEVSTTHSSCTKSSRKAECSLTDTDRCGSDELQTKRSTWEGLTQPSQQTISPEITSTPAGIKSKHARNTALKRQTPHRSQPCEIVSRYIPTPPQLTIENAIRHITIENESNAAGGACAPIIHVPEPDLRSEGGGDGGMSILQKLAAQCGATMDDLDPKTGAVSSGRHKSLKEAKTQQNLQVKTTSSCGTSTDEPSLSGYRRPPQKKEENETVFIDLRQSSTKIDEPECNFEAIKCALRSNTTPRLESSDSDDGSEEEQVLWHEQRRRMKEALRRGQPVPDVKQIHSKTKKSGFPQGPRGEAAACAQRLAHVPKTCGQTPEQAQEITQKPTPVDPTTAKPLRLLADTPGDKEKQTRLEDAKRLREQKEKERQSRIRLGKRLDALRPTASVRGKQTAAEQVPTVFDVEASYEAAPQSLPPDLPADLESVLLTVHLSSNGQIIQHRGKTHKTVDNGVGISMSYAALVTWLLSLVSADLQAPPEAQFMAPVPFWVIGLQQMFVEDDLCLYVAVRPRERYTQKDTGVKSKKSKRRDEVKHSSPFQQIVSRFLSTNCLGSVAPWLHDLTPIHITTCGSSGKPFVYAPKEAKITDKPLSTFIHVHPDPNSVKKIFSIPVGFFWQTVENEELQSDTNIHDTGVDYETQNTMSLVYKKVYRDHMAMMGILSRVVQDGFDLAGVRLLYPTYDFMKKCEATVSAHKQPQVMHVGPILALAIRGTFARSLWIEAVGPSDPVLARRTDPYSLIAQFGGESREELLIFVPRNPSRVSQELSRWFGGRVPRSGVIDVGKDLRESHGDRPGSTDSGERPSSAGKSTRSSSTGKKRKHLQHQESDEDLLESEIPTNRPVATLCATTRSEILLVISPLIPVRTVGLILASCQRRGYQLRGVRRTQLNHRKATSLGMTDEKATIFSGRTPAATGSPTVPTTTVLHTPCTLLLLNKENAGNNSGSLVEHFMLQMSLINMLGCIQDKLSVPLMSDHLFYVVPYTEGYLNILGGNFSKVPETDLSTAPGYIAPQIHSNPEMEQIVVLTLTGHLHMKTFGLFLGRLLGVVPFSKSSPVPTLGESLELLGFKWLPSLRVQYAKELTPYEVGDKEWKSSIQTLTSEPAVVLVLRGINAFSRVEDVVRSRGPHQRAVPAVRLDKIMSPTPQLAFRLCGLFFHDKELFADDEARSLLPYLPPNRSSEDSASVATVRSPSNEPPAHTEESIFRTMLSGPRVLTTVLLAKPNVVCRQMGKLLKRLALTRFSVVGCQLRTLSFAEAEAVLHPSVLNNEDVKMCHLDHLTSAPSLVLAVQRENAIKHIIDLIGPEDPQVARRQSQQLWRALFGVNAVVNGLHCSATYSRAVHELKLFFPEGLCSKANVELTCEAITCPAEDVIIDVKHSVTRETVLRPVSTHGRGDHIPVSLSLSPSSYSKFSLPSISILTQTNCILLPPALLRPEGRSSKLGYVEVIDGLIVQGFLIVGMRMVWFTQRQAEYYLHLCDAGSFALVPLLTSGPSLVLVVQRDNAVMAFDSLLGSSYIPTSLYARFGNQIFRPKDVKQALQHLSFFFHELMPGAQAEISRKLTSS